MKLVQIIQEAVWSLDWWPTRWTKVCLNCLSIIIISHSSSSVPLHLSVRETQPSFTETVPVYVYCLDEVISSTHFCCRKCCTLDDVSPHATFQGSHGLFCLPRIHCGYAAWDRNYSSLTKNFVFPHTLYQSYLLKKITAVRPYSLLPTILCHALLDLKFHLSWVTQV